MKLKGINKDIQPIDTPEGSYKGAQNIVIEKEGAKSNERGFDRKRRNVFTGDFLPNGTIESADGICVIFGITQSNGHSVVGLLEEVGDNTTYQVILSTPPGEFGLNFNINYAITGEIHKNVLGQYIVAWVDDVNKPRVLNITELPFEVDGSRVPLDMSKVTLSKMFPDIDLPFFNLERVNDGGGNLEAGVYYFTLRYIYPDNTKTDWYNISNAVNVVKSTKSESFLNYQGSQGGTATNKSIRLVLDNLDLDFLQYQIGVIKKIGGVISAVSERTYYTTNNTIVYSGLETEEEFPVNLTDVLVNNQVYDNIHTLTQLDRRLYIANVQDRPDLDYQQYANDIELEWTSKNIGIDSIRDSHKSEEYTFFNRAFMPDEVYAFYITFIYKDGGYSQAYHIPGRLPNAGEDALVTNPDLQAIDPTAKNFHFFNYAASDGTMGYWEDEETYPSNAGFGANAGQPVRHHKFPSLPNLEDWGRGVDIEPYNGDNFIFTTSFIIGGVTERRTLFLNSEVNFETPLAWGNFLTTPSFASDYGILLYKQGEADYATSIRYRARKRHMVTVDFGWDTELQVKTGGLNLFTSLNTKYIACRMVGKIIRGEEEYIFYDRYEHADTSKIDFWDFSVFDSEGAEFGHQRGFTLSLNEGDIVEFSGTMYASCASIVNLDADVDVLKMISSLVATVVFIPTLLGDTPATSFASSTGRILGINAKNIVIPPEIKDKVQGYQIGYATRDFNQSTSLTTAFMFPQNFFGDEANNGEYRLYSPDLELIKPSLDPTYINVEYDVDIDTNVYTPTPAATFRIYGVEPSSFSYTPSNNSAANNLSREACSQITTTEIIPYPTLSLPLPPPFSSNITFVYQNNYKLVTLKRLNKNVYNNFFNQKIALINRFMSVTEESYQYQTNTQVGDNLESESLFLYGGDIHNNYHFLRIYRNGNSYSEDEEDNSTLYDLDIMFPMLCWSIVNAQLIYEETAQEEETIAVDKFRKHPIFSSLPAEFNIQRQYTGLIDSDKQYSFKEISEFYQDHKRSYNGDYTSLHDLNPIIIKGIEPATDVHAYRVHRAQPIDPEDTEIKWRNFLPLDYYELESKRGAIWNIQHFKTQLIIHLTNSLFLTQPIERLQLDGTTAVLGTGDIFKFPPNEVVPDTQGYGGTLSQQGAILTKFGYIFYDESKKALNILSDGLSDISVIGLDDFFRDKIFLTQNRLISETTFNNIDVADNPFIDRGITMVYDEYYNRLIFSLLDIDRDKYFTASFDFSSKTWQSHKHTYNPNKLFNINNNVYSFRDGELYKHNSDNRKGTYYEVGGERVRSESWIDVVFNSASSLNKHFYGVNWLSEIQNEIGGYLHDETFDKIIIYNSYQASQEIDLVKIRNLVENYNIRDTRGTWNFNKFRDIVINEVREGIQTIIDEDDNFIPTSVNNTKSWFNKKRFIDNFIVVRFIYSNSENKTLYLYNVEANKRLASR